jgi:hypothetical protein
MEAIISGISSKISLVKAEALDSSWERTSLKRVGMPANAFRTTVK